MSPKNVVLVKRPLLIDLNYSHNPMKVKHFHLVKLLYGYLHVVLFYALNDSYGEDNGTIIYTGVHDYWKNCESSSPYSAYHLGFLNIGWCIISGGEPVQWGAVDNPMWFIKWYWWPKEVLGRKPKPQAFPPPIPTIHSRLEMRKQVLMLETRFSGFHNYVFTHCADNVLKSIAQKKTWSFRQTYIQRNQKPKICLITLIRQWEPYLSSIQD